jgi:SAM-dependent methyltransferase
LAFLPSTLMLGVTAHLSTDVAAIPLLWVVPLAIYLTTFIVAFAHGSRRPPVRTTRAAVGLALVALVLATYPVNASLGVHLAVSLVMLAAVGYAAHARLAAHRPAPDRLTTYYLVIAAGGALGGLLNGLLAPVVFDRVLEYPLALAAVPLLAMGLGRPAVGGERFPGDPGIPSVAPIREPGRSPWLLRQVRAKRIPAVLAVGGAVLLAVAVHAALEAVTEETVFGVLVLVGCVLTGWLLSYYGVALSIAMVLFYAGAVVLAPGVVEQTRTFFGSYTVESAGSRHILVHGTTMHGTQFRDQERRDVPTTYYVRGGPLGDLFGFDDGERFDDVAVVGLGTGTLAAYGREGQSMTFFEIDAEMVELARDPALFSYLTDSAADIETVVGDGRLAIEDQPRESYDLIFLDAFSSDAIPAHLLTVEAMQTYAERLRPRGILAVHISNRVFDLEPVVAAAAEELGWSALIGVGGELEEGGARAVWMVLSPDEPTLTRLSGDRGWGRSDPDRLVRWTDSYSSVLSVLR